VGGSVGIHVDAGLKGGVGILDLIPVTPSLQFVGGGRC
jgi:hypothetical protein